jgi:hypothetical protein
VVVELGYVRLLRRALSSMPPPVAMSSPAAIKNGIGLPPVKGRVWAAGCVGRRGCKVVSGPSGPSGFEMTVGSTVGPVPVVVVGSSG